MPNSDSPMLPVGLSSEWKGDVLTLRIRWNWKLGLIGLLGAAACAGLPLFRYGDIPAGQWPLPVWGILGLGVVFASVSIWFLANRATVTARHGSFQVRHGPMPWPGKNVPIAEIVGFDVERTGVDRSYTYRVNALLSDGGRKSVVVLLNSLSDAAQVKDALQTFLSRHDRAAGKSYSGRQFH